eukprot:17153-Heterococcus_DN1.PRE.3
MTQPSSSTPSDLKVAAAQLLAELLPYCVTNSSSGSSSGCTSSSSNSMTVLPALQSSGMPWAAAGDSNAAAAAATTAGASKKTDVKLNVAVGACGEQALAVIQNLCDSCCAPTIAQLHSILQQITGQVIVYNSTTATTATSTVTVCNASTPSYDSRLALSIVSAWCGLAVWAVTDTVTPVTTTGSSASSSSSTDKGVTQAALNLHKMVTFASQLTNDWRWALLLSLLQLVQVNSSVRQLFERSSSSSSGTAITDLKSALAAIHVQAFTGSGVVYTNCAVTAYKRSVQMLLYEVCKALSEATSGATTHELVMVASAACAQQCIRMTARITAAVAEPQATSSSTTATSTACTVSHKMVLQCLEWLTVCTATATASASGANSTAASAVATAVLRAAITLLTVHACSSSTVIASTGNAQLSMQEQTALRTSLLHMYDRIPNSNTVSTEAAAATSAAVTELQNSTGIVIAGARMLCNSIVSIAVMFSVDGTCVQRYLLAADSSISSTSATTAAVRAGLPGDAQQLAKLLTAVIE